MSNACFTFAENSFVPGMPVRSAGAVAVAELPSINVPPARWMMWLQPQRIAYLRMVTPRNIHESLVAFNNRLNSISTAITTRALMSLQSPRPAGDANIYDFSSFGGASLVNDVNNDSSGTKTTTDTSGSGLSQADRTNLINGAASIIGMAGNVIAAAISSGNATERARIEAETTRHIADLRAQAQSSDPATSATAQSQIDLLTQLQAMLNPDSMSDSTKIMLGLGAAAVLILAFMAFRPRKNPVLYKNRGPSRFKTKEKRIPTRFVAARHLR